jgi:hypothetical protein
MTFAAIFAQLCGIDRDRARREILDTIHEAQSPSASAIRWMQSEAWLVWCELADISPADAERIRADVLRRIVGEAGSPSASEVLRDHARLLSVYRAEQCSVKRVAKRVGVIQFTPTRKWVDRACVWEALGAWGAGEMQDREAA